MSLLRFALPVLALALLLAPASALAQDADGDGRPAGGLDCDDTNPDIYLNAPEICDDGIDQSCSGADLTSDSDDDGWMDVRCFTAVDCAADPTNPACAPENFDCNDNDETLNRDDVDEDGFSTCDGDCDDEDASIDPVDDDGDGFDECSGDCDDSDAALNPDGVEVCGDGEDNDCDGEPDNVDVDGDGAVSPDCGGDDCDDTDASLNPLNPEAAATCNDLIDNDCDGTTDNLDEDCFEGPEVDAGPDIQDRYLGGTIVVVLDGSGTTDFNTADELIYTWTLEEVGGGADGVATLQTDPSSPFAYVSFSAPGSESREWTYVATLVVSDGNPATDDATEEIDVRFWRPSYVPPKSCSASAPAAPSSLFALLLLLGATAVRRRRVT
jgi:MYXO-CTERM domain-containing protein